MKNRFSFTGVKGVEKMYLLYKTKMFLFSFDGLISKTIPEYTRKRKKKHF